VPLDYVSGEMPNRLSPRVHGNKTVSVLFAPLGQQ
jgi:hypothetical protein